MKKKSLYIVIAFIILFIIGGFVFMFGNNKVTAKDIEMPKANAVTDEITYGVVIEESFTNTVENINELAVVFNKLYEEGDVDIVIELLSGNDVILSGSADVENIESQHRVHIYADTPISGYLGKKLTLRISSIQSCEDDTGLQLFYNNEAFGTFTFGDENINGNICFSLTGNNE